VERSSAWRVGPIMNPLFVCKLMIFNNNLFPKFAGSENVGLINVVVTNASLN